MKFNNTVGAETRKYPAKTGLGKAIPPFRIVMRICASPLNVYGFVKDIAWEYFFATKATKKTKIKQKIVKFMVVNRFFLCDRHYNMEVSVSLPYRNRG